MNSVLPVVTLVRVAELRQVSPGVAAHVDTKQFEQPLAQRSVHINYSRGDDKL